MGGEGSVSKGTRAAMGWPAAVGASSGSAEYTPVRLTFDKDWD